MECMRVDRVATGEKIAREMRIKGLAVKDIQLHLGLSCPQGIYLWLHGTCLPSVDNLYGLSRLLDVHMEDLLVSENK